MAIILGQRVELSPEEALQLAQKLLNSAIYVMNRRALHGHETSDYLALVGTNYDGDDVLSLEFRVGMVRTHSSQVSR